jgi:hypothetical protein
LYQFNKTLVAVLASGDDEVVTVEGIVEDIEVTSTGSRTAIQCKYHEASSGFTKGTVYKPLFQMLVHFHTVDSGETSYVLFAHFPDSTGQMEIGESELQAAIDSEDRRLSAYQLRLSGGVGGEWRQDWAVFLTGFATRRGDSGAWIVRSHDHRWT